MPARRRPQQDDGWAKTLAPLLNNPDLLPTLKSAIETWKAEKQKDRDSAIAAEQSKRSAWIESGRVAIVVILIRTVLFLVSLGVAANNKWLSNETVAVLVTAVIVDGWKRSTEPTR
jgi:hypothetical protein